MKAIEEKNDDAGTESMGAVPDPRLESLTLSVFVITIMLFAFVTSSVMVGLAFIATGFLFVILPSARRRLPLPHSRRDTLMGAALTALFFIATCIVIASHRAGIATELKVQWIITGIIGLALTARALHIPQRHPKWFTESGWAFFRAMSLNGAWFFAWYLLQGSTPAFSIRWLCPALTDFPICFTVAVYLGRRVVDRFNYPVRKESEDFISQEARKEIRLRKRRNILYVYRSYVGEIAVDGCLAVFFWAVFFRTPRFDPAQAANNIVGGIMLLLTFRYIRHANRRADALLERDLREIENRKSVSASNVVFFEKVVGNQM